MLSTTAPDEYVDIQIYFLSSDEFVLRLYHHLADASRQVTVSETKHKSERFDKITVVVKMFFLSHKTPHSVFIKTNTRIFYAF